MNESYFQASGLIRHMLFIQDNGVAYFSQATLRALWRVEICR